MPTFDASCLEYRLTDTERQEFEERGYFSIDDALSPSQVERLTGLVDRTFDRKVAEGHPANERLFYPNFIPDSPLFLDLVDYEKVLPKVWDILGWNIYLYHAHLIVTPPSGESPNNKTFGWHQDIGRVNVELESSPRPHLSLKVAYFLSHTSEVNRSNFWVIPGSHLWDSIERPVDGIGQPKDAVPVLAKPGTAVFFLERSLDD